MVELVTIFSISLRLFLMVSIKVGDDDGGDIVGDDDGDVIIILINIILAR